MTRQRLGQHFLKDGAVIEQMLAVTPKRDDEIVVEIGPGQGVLTRALAARGDLVVAIEWDEELAARLAIQFRDHANVTMVQNDIRTFDLVGFLASISGGKALHYSIIANIPYYLTSYLLRQVFELKTLPSRMTLLMQKEVAERLCAAPGASECSVLTVMVQAYCRPQIVMHVPASSFTPPPRVESAVVAFRAISSAYFDDIDQKAFFRVVKAGFGEKRKRLANALAGGLHRDKQAMDALTKTLRFAPDIRAQELSLAQWKALYHAVERQ